MSQHSERHLQNIASSRERPVTPILDGGWVSKAWYIDVEWYMKVCVTKMRKMTEALTLSVCENVQCQHRPCQPLTVFRRCASRQIDTSITSPLHCHVWKLRHPSRRGFIGGLEGGSSSDVAGSERLNIPQLNHLRALDKSSVQWTQAFHWLAAGIAAKYVCYVLMSVASMRVI